MNDEQHPRGDDGRFVMSVPLEEIVERDRREHLEAHKEDRQIAKESAQRIERQVEVTAVRIESAVKTALDAATETSKVHAEAHGRDHLAHDRTHLVESEQVAKAEAVRTKEQENVATALKEYKDSANEWQRTFREFSNLSPTRKEVEALMSGQRLEIGRVIDAVTELKLEVRTSASSTKGRAEGLTGVQKAVLGYGALVVSASGIIVGLVALLH